MRRTKVTRHLNHWGIAEIDGIACAVGIGQVHNSDGEVIKTCAYPSIAAISTVSLDGDAVTCKLGHEYRLTDVIGDDDKVMHHVRTHYAKVRPGQSLDESRVDVLPIRAHYDVAAHFATACLRAA